MSISRRIFVIAGAGLSSGLASAQSRKSGSRVLVACFSRTGNTRIIAGQIHTILGGNHFDIAPAHAYPDDYDIVVEQARQERASGYMPPLRQKLANFAAYDTVFLGFPIWAMTTPQIILSFLSEHDLSGKTVVPFCSHKGYGRGQSFATIAASAPRARHLDGFDIEGTKATGAQQAIGDWLRRIGMLPA